jgi:hypothetical protein
MAIQIKKVLLSSNRLHIISQTNAMVSCRDISFATKHYACLSLYPLGSTAQFRLWPPPQFSSIYHFQSLTPIPFSSLPTSSIYLLLGLPSILIPRSKSNVNFLDGSLSLIRTICPAHLSLADLIH